MLIPYLHFNGDCTLAVAVYEKAFNTKAEGFDYGDDGKTIRHARMKIRRQTVFLNDNEELSDIKAHLVVTF